MSDKSMSSKTESYLSQAPVLFSVRDTAGVGEESLLAGAVINKDLVNKKFTQKFISEVIQIWGVLGFLLFTIPFAD